MSTAVYESDYLSIRDAASMLGVAPITIRRKIETGELLAVQLGGCGSSIRIPREALEGWLYAEDDHDPGRDQTPPAGGVVV
jgi:excisionase family DNA binding protein